MSSSNHDQLSSQQCDLYWNEYKDCSKWSSKFHRYYAYGDTKLDCAKWKRDYENCIAWHKHGDASARAELLKSEKTKADTLMKNRTNVWEYRTEPPRMWHFPGQLQYQPRG